MRVFRKITIDGAVPYKELESYPFDSSTDWKIETLESNGESLEFYLSAGRHTLGISVNVSVYESVLMTLKTMIAHINDFALQIRYLTGGARSTGTWSGRSGTTSRIDETLAAMREALEGEYSTASRINGNEDSQELTSFRTAIMLLERLMKDRDEIPKKLDLLVRKRRVDRLGTLRRPERLQNMPLTLDRVYIYAGESAPSFKRASVFASLWEGIKRFVDSFRPARYEAGGARIGRSGSVDKQSQTVLGHNPAARDDDFTPKRG